MRKVLFTKQYQSALVSLKTIRDFLRFGLSELEKNILFYGHGTDNARDEIIYLCLSTLSLGPQLDSIWLDARLLLSEKKQLLRLLQRRIEEKIPVAYLVSQAWFAGLAFYVDERVLIPRSPLAELIQQQFAPWIEATNVRSLLDLCTGSGCIAIACAYAFPQAIIDASDISEKSLTVAQINRDRHHLKEHIHLYESNLFTNLPLRQYDVIISNPPYVNLKDFSNLPAEFLHEPALALTAGEQGLDCVIRILKESLCYLTEEGILIVEVGNSKAALIEYYPLLPFTWLEFERSEGEVFLLTAQQLKKYANYL